MFDVEIYGGPRDGYRFKAESDSYETTDPGQVHFRIDDDHEVILDAVPSPTREGVVLALWSTARDGNGGGEEYARQPQ